MRTAPNSRSVSSVWTIPLLCAGIGLVACCLLIPAADDNRRLAYERERLARDLAQIEKQISVNDEFLKRLADDPNLSERLARRQMKMVREGTGVMELHDSRAGDEMSPFLLVKLPPPEPLPEYQPVGGKLAALCRHPKSQLYLIGAGLLMAATALVMSANTSRSGPQKDRVM